MKFSYLKTAYKLGACNIAYIAWYRFTIRTGLRKIRFKRKKLVVGQNVYLAGALRNEIPVNDKDKIVIDANRIVGGEFNYFYTHWKHKGLPPEWFEDPFTGNKHTGLNKHWVDIDEFHRGSGDIKNIWDLSRFNWLISLSRAYSTTGHQKYLSTINKLVKDWADQNPYNTGPNWKCGQETSIRLFNLLNAAMILSNLNDPSDDLKFLVYVHLLRINANIRYAFVQDNNHGTSESAALFIGGAWLNSLKDRRYSDAAVFEAQGRKWLEKRLNKLVGDDGSFSQHSTNYHRMLVDTLCFTEHWRKLLGQSSFSESFYKKARAAVKWMISMVDPESGEAPNLGGNDGSMINNLHSFSYKSYIPSVKIATKLFNQPDPLTQFDCLEPAIWLGIKTSSVKENTGKKDQIFTGGYTILNGENSWGLIRFPNFRFRPAHNDVFHFDLWHKGRNILCDAGSYSYNPPQEEENIDLRSVKYHNTISFNGSEQMPFIGRFLMDKWIDNVSVGQLSKTDSGVSTWTASYKDHMGNMHERTVRVFKDEWQLIDNVSGSFTFAEMYLNILSINITADANVISLPGIRITLPDECVFQTGKSFISPGYNKKVETTRLTVNFDKPGIYKTIIKLD